jgi:hypothetical protein
MVVFRAGMTLHQAATMSTWLRRGRGRAAGCGLAQQRDNCAAS